MTHEQRLARLGDTLPPAPRPVAVYRPVVVVSGLAYVSGHGPLRVDGSLITGRVGQELALALTGRWPMSCVNPTVLPKLDRRRWQPISMERGPNS